MCVKNSSREIWFGGKTPPVLVAILMSLISTLFFLCQRHTKSDREVVGEEKKLLYIYCHYPSKKGFRFYVNSHCTRKHENHSDHDPVVVLLTKKQTRDEKTSVNKSRVVVAMMMSTRSVVVVVVSTTVIPSSSHHPLERFSFVSVSLLL